VIRKLRLILHLVVTVPLALFVASIASSAQDAWIVLRTLVPLVAVIVVSAGITMRLGHGWPAALTSAGVCMGAAVIIAWWVRRARSSGPRV
jgi:ABC-type transport system involved in cytochrome bd biosynthesis fused ATPase/permease subunit